MKLVLSHLLVFALGAATVWYFPKISPKPVVKATAGIGDMGLREGDMLLSVNGVSDESMMNVMAEGLERGDVCVVFERASVKREVCLKKS